jgi:hypothetical protein
VTTTSRRLTSTVLLVTATLGRPRTALLAAVALALGAVFWVTSSPSVGASSPESINLGDWALTLPVNSAGHLSGKAASLRPARLTPKWLTRQSDGSLGFYAPSRGATTSHSLHTRTELVAVKSFAAGTPGHRLIATLAAKELPTATKTIIVGQIHGYGKYRAAPFVLLELRGKTLELDVESKPKLKGSKGPSDGEVTKRYVLMSGITLGQTFTYSITTEHDALRVTTSVGTGHTRPHSISASVPKAWKGLPVNFHAGDYGQDNAETSTAGGSEVIFSALAYS